jgi:L-seryl-tRNA(Ser) seleniumtransferase
LPVNAKAELNALLRNLPQVEAVLTCSELEPELATYRRDVVKREVVRQLAAARRRIQSGKLAQAPAVADIARQVGDALEQLSRGGIRPVINATGVILHTNLGRAVLSKGAADYLQRVSAGYCDLEFDLRSGSRSQRDFALERLVIALTGCEAATVVNNNAAAVFLILNTLAAGKEVITSRGELVEIGGSFRVPDVVASAGCRLVEVGTTNRTRIGDFERAINDNTAVLLKTHTSNFRLRGFTEETTQEELVALGRKHGIPVFNDLGSGYLEPEEGVRLPEPGILETLADGPDVVSFSGDKLLCGPQAGIITGGKELIAQLRKNPLWRVLRIDKFTAGALAATLAEALRNGSRPSGIAAKLELHSLENQTNYAEQISAQLVKLQPGWQVGIEDGEGTYGGGSLPDETVPARLVAIRPEGLEAEELDSRMRRGTTPVVGYLRSGAYVLNMLSLLPGEAEKVATALGEAVNG